MRMDQIIRTSGQLLTDDLDFVPGAGRHATRSWAAAPVAGVVRAIPSLDAGTP